MIATCKAPGCANAGIPLDVGPPPVDETTGQELGMNVVCGVCGNPIGDVSAGPEPEQV